MRLTQELDSKGKEATWEELKEQFYELRERAVGLRKKCENDNMGIQEIYECMNEGHEIGTNLRDTLETFLQEEPFSDNFQDELRNLVKLQEEANNGLPTRPDLLRQNLIPSIDGAVMKLDLYELILSNSDLVTKPEVSEKERKELKAEEKERILLERLYSINQRTNAKIPASWILEGNGIDVDRAKKHEMCKALEEKDLIHNEASKDGCFLKITHEGEKEVENMGEEAAISEEVQQLKNRIEEIKEELKSKVGEEAEFTRCGLEVLFEELEKIKGQADNQDRDTLRQIIWGKFKEMFDSKEVADKFLKIAYDRLTEELPKLPGVS